MLFLLLLLCNVSPLLSTVTFHHNGSIHVGILDASGIEHHLIAIRSIVGVSLIPKNWENTLGSVFHWTASRWRYNEGEQMLIPFKNTDQCLVADPRTLTLSIANRSLLSSTQNCRFVYYQDRKQLFWINPINQQKHPIYLEKDCTRIFRVTPFTSRIPLISKNPMSKWINNEFENAHLITSRPRIKRLCALILHSLKHRVMANLTSIEYEKYIKMIGSLMEYEFGYFMKKQNRYLLSDGHTVCPSKKGKFNDTNYYGLWRLNEHNHLIHFLSGKYLQSIPNGASRNIQMLENMLIAKAKLTSIKETFYDLKVNEYSKDYHDSFVTVDGNESDYEMNIQSAGSMPQRIGGMISARGADAYLAFVNKTTYDYVWRILLKDIAVKDKKMAQKFVRLRVNSRVAK